MHPRTPCPEGAAEAWRAGPACQPLHLPLVSQIRLVAHQHDDDVAAPLCPDIINPLRGLLEGVEVWRLKVRIKLGVRSSSWRERGKVGKRQETGGSRDVGHAPLDTEEGHGACTLRHPGRMWSVHPQTPRRDVEHAPSDTQEGQECRPNRPVGLGLPQETHVCLWSCCLGPWRAPCVAEPPSGGEKSPHLEGHCYDLTNGLVALMPHLRIRSDLEAQSKKWAQ